MMIWDEIISLTDNNKPYRFRVTTMRQPTGSQCNITVDELDEHDTKQDVFDFTYDVKEEMPQADYSLHNKPIASIIRQMLTIRPDAEGW